MNPLLTALRIFPSREAAFKVLAPVFFLFAMFYSAPAHAVSGCISLFGVSFCANSCEINNTLGIGQGSLGALDNSIGTTICRFIESVAQVPTLFAALSYLFGLVLAVFAILKLREHVEQPQQVSIWEPIKRFVAGGMFFALPYVMSAAANTISGGDINDIGGLPFQAGSPSSGGLDSMLFFFVLDIFSPVMALVKAFGYIAGIILIMVGISRMLKSTQEGAKGPGGLGTIMTFLVAGVLLSSNTLLTAVSGSLFDTTVFGLLSDGHVAKFPLLSVGTGDAAINSNITAVLGSVVSFMVIIGVISFVRGIFIMRDVAEGNGQASLMAASTHIIGGALAVNMGSVINAIQSTFGLSVVSFI